MLVLPFPEDLPRTSDALRHHAATDVTRVLETRSWRPRVPGATGSELLAAVRTALCALPQARSSSVRPDPPPGAVADPDAHDAYCRIQRTNDPGLHVLVTAALQSYAEFVDDVLSGGSSLSSRHWTALHRAYESLLEYMRSHALGEPVTAEVVPLAVPYVGTITADPLERWILGHHVFLVLIQGLIVGLNCFESAYRDCEETTAAGALDLAADLMNGASAALHYAGDFPRTAYDATVRPTMMPPSVPLGMSGLLARDHSYLVKSLRSLRGTFATLESAWQVRYDRFASAFAEAYECHKLVCAHFGGDERPSLLNGEAAETGIEALEALKRTRLSAFMPTRVSGTAS